jgi:hypothetical protein
MKAQGATEYLVLLAVVLIIALVSVSLLGFFPSMASDAQETQSETYWQSASPISITETGARFVYDGAGNFTFVYLRIRNTGSYPITISKVLANGTSISYVWTNYWGPDALISSKFANIAPGEERFFGYYTYFPGVPDLGAGNQRYFSFSGSDANIYNANFRNAAASICSRTAPYGTLIANNFGFEYVATIDGQAITKRQIGAKPLVIKCTNNYN